MSRKNPAIGRITAALTTGTEAWGQDARHRLRSRPLPEIHGG